MLERRGYAVTVARNTIEAMSLTNVPGNHQRKGIAELVGAVEQDGVINGLWKYNLSQLYYTPKVTAVVKRILKLGEMKCLNIRLYSK